MKFVVENPDNSFTIYDGFVTSREETIYASNLTAQGVSYKGITSKRVSLTLDCECDDVKTVRGENAALGVMLHLNEGLAERMGQAFLGSPESVDKPSAAMKRLNDEIERLGTVTDDMEIIVAGELMKVRVGRKND